MRIVVPEGEPIRLDRFVAERLGGRSRRAVRELIAAGGVRANRRIARKGQLVRAGDVIDVDEPAPAALAPQPDLPIRVLREDDAVVAVDKPAGMPSVALRAGDRETLANALLARFPELAAASHRPLEAGLVHRLDTGTSGVLLAARRAPIWTLMREQFRAGAVTKRYLALVAGAVSAPGTVRTPIAHRPRRRREMWACADPDQARSLGARPAVTRYRPCWSTAHASLLEVDLLTGVRHQIRVHLASIGHAVLGDPLYAPPEAMPAPRLMLHAASLEFRHPVSGDAMRIESPPPPDFSAVLDGYRRRARRVR